jgi:hypothetical protein
VFRDVGDVTSAADLKMIPGLHLLFGEGVAPKLAILLSHINPLSLWLIAVMAIAVSILADVEKTRARITAVILWGLAFCLRLFLPPEYGNHERKLAKPH